MKKIKLSIILISFAMFLFACGGGSDTNNNEGETTNNNEEVSNDVVDDEVNGNVETTNTENDNQIVQESCGFPIESVDDFLYYAVPDGMPATFESSNGVYIFFRADGTMAGGGPTGEESMWEANWEFQPGNTTGMIVLNITMAASNPAYQFGNGAYNVEYFPDDAALILNCVDFIKQEY